MELGVGFGGIALVTAPVEIPESARFVLRVSDSGGVEAAILAAGDDLRLAARRSSGDFHWALIRTMTWLRSGVGVCSSTTTDEKNPESAKKSVSLRAFNSIAAGDPEFKQMVDELGIGNDKRFIRVFYRIGKNMRPDTYEQGGGGSGGKSVASALWPDMK